MANKRDIKKDINYLSGELFAEVIACTHYTKVNQQDADNVMLNILHMQDDLICRVSHIQPGMKAKVFFKKLRSDMLATTEEIVDQINALI